MDVTVVYSPAPRVVREVVLQLSAEVSVRDAVRASGLLDEFPEIELRRLSVGIWGRKVTPGEALREEDRVEIYRPLQVDPKVARRERFNRQGARSAGLFANRRDGAKAGY